jgi:hypothetical protein
MGHLGDATTLTEAGYVGEDVRAVGPSFDSKSASPNFRGGFLAGDI